MIKLTYGDKNPEKIYFKSMNRQLVIQNVLAFTPQNMEPGPYERFIYSGINYRVAMKRTLN